MRLPLAIWAEGECEECGSMMKVPVGQEEYHSICNQCKLLSQLARFETLLENNMGWR